MERYFILDKFNTWYDWRLVLTDKDVTPPEPKTNYVDIGGMSGSLDLSESLTGEITYKNRTIKASFWTCEGSFKERAKLLRDIRIALHGKKIKIIEPDDPDHYFIGRVSIVSENNILPYAEFTIEAICEPWRYSINKINRNIQLSGESKNVVINNRGAKTVYPIFTANPGSTATLIFNKKLFGLHAGPNTPYILKMPEIKLYPGVNILDLYVNGSLTITYEEADL